MTGGPVLRAVAVVVTFGLTFGLGIRSRRAWVAGRRGAACVGYVLLALGCVALDSLVAGGAGAVGAPVPVDADELLPGVVEPGPGAPYAVRRGGDVELCVSASDGRSWCVELAEVG